MIEAICCRNVYRALFLVTVSSALCFASDSNDEIVAKLREVHMDLEQVRKEAYGNCLVEGRQIVNYENAPPNRKKPPDPIYFRFWSRNGEFFRADMFKDEERRQIVSRIIVRPEGHFIFNSTPNGIAIVATGNVWDGVMRLYDLQFFNASTRAYPFFAESWFANFAGIDKYALQLEKDVTFRVDLKEGEPELAVTIDMLRPNSKSITSLVFSSNRPHVLKSFSRRSNQIESSVQCSFGAISDSIAKGIVRRVKDPSGAVGIQSSEIDFIELGKQPLSIFDVAKPSTRSRSSILLIVVLSCVTVVIIGILRRRRS